MPPVHNDHSNGQVGNTAPETVARDPSFAGSTTRLMQTANSNTGQQSNAATPIFPGGMATTRLSPQDQPAALVPPLPSKRITEEMSHPAQATEGSENMLDSDADNNDVLKALQSQQLQAISRKHEGKKRRNDKNNTTSLRDLDLARTPVKSQRQQASKRGGAQDIPSLTLTPNLEETSGEAVTEVDSRNTPMLLSHTSAPIEVGGQRVEIKTPRPKWASKEDVKATKDDTDSNAWGSAAPSDATRDTNASVKSFGKMLHKSNHSEQDLPIVDWEGQLMPPPAEWAERPRYNNNNQDFKERFKGWQAGINEHSQSRYRFSNGVEHRIITSKELANLNMFPDGISLVDRTMTIDSTNSAHYGYTADPEDALKYVQQIAAAEYDFDWGKVDMADPDNAKFKHECTSDLVENWLKHLHTSQDKLNEARNTTQFVSQERNDEDFAVPMEKSHPKLDIYLRPALERDLEELTRIYNCHIRDGVTPCETREISPSCMGIRMSMSEESRLPFIVAAKKNQREAKDVPIMDDEEFSRRMSLPVTHKQRITITKFEVLAGFCCAGSFTASDYVEHTSADLELYVDPRYKRMGVGKCLLDKVLEICDVGHRRKTECAFHCDSAIRHMYGPGGKRNVHKIYLQLRKWHVPKAANINLERGRKHSKLALAKTWEDEYGRWMKQWLESFDFDVEGCLQKVGAKNGRYIDLVYLGRETTWQPAEGQVPGPDPRDVYEVGETENDHEY